MARASKLVSILVLLNLTITLAPATRAAPQFKAAPAQAGISGSIVFILDNNVFLADPVTGNGRQLTTDGTAADPYESPSQANDGTIVVARDDLLYHMDPFGRLLHPPFDPPVVFELGIFDTALSPNGEIVAYTTGEICENPSTGELEACTGTGFVYVDGSTSGLPDMQVFYNNPYWLSGSKLALDYRSFYIATYDLGAAEPVEWFGNEPTNFLYESDPEVSSDGNEVAAVVDQSIALYTLSGPPPAAPTPKCGVTGPAGTFDDPTWSPQGTALAWEEFDSDQIIEGEGIWVAVIGELASVDCTQVQIGQFVPNGTDPDWGPATFVPGFARAVALSLSKHLVAKGSVSVNGDFPACLSNVPVTIQRRKSGSWVNVKSVSTGSSGSFNAKIPDKPGTYRAKAGEVTKSGSLCLPASSAKKTHKH